MLVIYLVHFTAFMRLRSALSDLRVAQWTERILVLRKVPFLRAGGLLRDQAKVLLHSVFKLDQFCLVFFESPFIERRSLLIHRATVGANSSLVRHIFHGQVIIYFKVLVLEAGF